MTDLHLYEILETLGVRVETANLPPDRDGEYIHARRLIRLHQGMPRRLRRSVLAHETAHAVFEDVPSHFGPANARQERRADEWAALRLISTADYVRAEQLHEGHDEGIAVELDVTIDLIEAYRGLLLRIGDSVYIDAKMGAGQFRDRAEAN